DLSFPEFKKIAEAFGYSYYCASSNKEMKELVDKVLKVEEPVFCEIFTDTKQVWEPKSSTKRLEDGTLVSPPLEDLAPFLPREELKKQMFIPLLDEE
ncbi:MAG: thiamine pyrophosphate-binding protein, partial [Wujia sp.]|nr:thiamine pyrophosphate-binding protein [Wujia sp.]